jgi:hypothetical protein
MSRIVDRDSGLLFWEQTTTIMVGEFIILFLQLSFTGAMEHLHDDIEQICEFGTEPRLVQTPNQIWPISIKETAQTLTVVLAEWRSGRFLKVMVLLALGCSVEAVGRPYSDFREGGLVGAPGYSHYRGRASVPAARNPPAHRREIRIGV